MSRFVIWVRFEVPIHANSLEWIKNVECIFQPVVIRNDSTPVES